MITGEYILFENIIQNYVAMSIIGYIAYLIAKDNKTKAAIKNTVDKVKGFIK